MTKLLRFVGWFCIVVGVIGGLPFLVFLGGLEHASALGKREAEKQAAEAEIDRLKAADIAGDALALYGSPEMAKVVADRRDSLRDEMTLAEGQLQAATDMLAYEKGREWKFPSFLYLSAVISSTLVTLGVGAAFIALADCLSMLQQMALGKSASP